MTEDQNKFVKAFGDLVGLFDTKSRASATVAMICVILYLWYKTDQLNAARIQDQKEFKDQMITEIRRQITPAIAEVKATQDSNKVKIEKTAELIKPVLMKINQAINKMNDKK